MGANRQPNPFAPHHSNAGDSPTQAVVELIRASHCGLVFWSRQAIDIAAELMMRVSPDALQQQDAALPAAASKDWVMLRGFVVECKGARRPDGTVGFEVTIIFDPACSGPLLNAPKLPRSRAWTGTRGGPSPFGLN